LRHVVAQKLTDVSEKLTASIIIVVNKEACNRAFVSVIALIIEAVRAYETSITFYKTTWRNIPEDSHLHIAAV
jgi:hypothetical protein